MVFSSNVFLFLFLPAFLAAYYLCPERHRSWLIVGGSYLFYAWWRVDFLFLFIAVTVFNYWIGQQIHARGPRTAAARRWLVLGVAIACYILVRRLVLSRAGRAMQALAENEPLATSVGIDVTRYLVLAAVVSAAMAGAAGALYAHYVRIVDPDVFLFIYTVTMVIMVITGGKGTLAGPVVGGLIFGLLPEALRAAAIAPETQWIVYGVLMVLVVYFLPQGIVPALRRSQG